MTKALLNNFRVNARTQEQCGAAMSQILESNMRDLCPFDHFPKISLGDVVPCKGLPVGWQKTRS